MNGPTVFNLIAVTLVELAAVFWVGAQLWINFVLQASAEKHPEESNLNTQMERRFTRRFSLPTLGLLLLANFGVLYGQVLTLTGNNWGAALSFSLLSTQASSGRFGTYWLLRIGVVLLALLVNLYMILSQKRPHVIDQTLPLLNLFLGAILFIAITMSGDAAAVAGILVAYSVVFDWLHLLAAALWIGGMIYILLIYLPLLKTRPTYERVRSLLAVLPQFSPLAIAGVAIMAITGPLETTFHFTSLNQFISTDYGRALAIKILLVGGLLTTSAYHMLWLRPRLKKEYQKYTYARGRLEKSLAVASSVIAEGEGEPATSSVEKTAETTHPDKLSANEQKLLAKQVQLRGERLAQKTGGMMRILRWEPWLGVAIIFCVGLMNVFAGTLTSTTAPTTQQQGGTGSATAAPFNGTALTSDGKYNVTLNVNPNRFGTNVFTVHVTSVQTGQQLAANQASVTVYTTMLDMAMGTDSVELQADGKDGFSGSGDLAMGGNWGLQIQVRTPDKTLHEANFKIYAPF